MEFTAVNATTYDFGVVAAALGGGQSKAPSQKEGVVYVATHSAGGRAWEVAEASPAWIEDPDFNGCWLVFDQQSLLWVRLTSATSGSEVEAERLDNGMWELVLRMPVWENAPYVGAYAQTFLEATAGLQDEQLDYELLEDLELSLR